VCIECRASGLQSAAALALALAVAAAGVAGVLLADAAVSVVRAAVTKDLLKGATCVSPATASSRVQLSIVSKNIAKLNRIGKRG
jgi:hypothetical protein